MGEFVENENMMSAGMDNLKTIDMLQQLLQEEICRLVQGKVIVRFLVDGGFEGEVMIEVKDMQVRGDDQGVILSIDGYNGELCFKFQKTFQGHS